MYNVLMQHIAENLLSKCNGCLFAITIIGAILGEEKAQIPEKWKDVYEKFNDYADNWPPAEDYEGESKTIFAAIKLSLEYGQEESDRVGMENILRTLALFENIGMRTCPAIVVHLAWSYLQPQGGIIHFKILLNCLIARNLVEKDLGMLNTEYFLQDSWEFERLLLPRMVRDYVSMKLHAIDICSVLEKGSQELFMERKKILLATFLPICKTRHTNLEFALSLGQFYYENWEYVQLFTLLGTKAENAILLASQPHKVTQEDINALLHILNSDKIRAWAAACILSQLAEHFYEDDILQHRSIQGFIQNLKQQWKRLPDDYECDGYYPRAMALKLVKYSSFAEQFAIDEDFMEIVTNVIMHNRFWFKSDTLLLLFTLNQHKNVRNIFYQKYTKITMKNILKQISSKLTHETKLVLPINVCHSRMDVFHMWDLSLQYEDMLAMQIIDECGDDIVLGIFDSFFTFQNSIMTNVPPPVVPTKYPTHNEIIKLLFLILDGLAKRKEGEAIIIKHVHLLLRCFFGVYDYGMRNGVSKLIRHKRIAQALITQEGVELLVGALEQGKVAIVPLVLQCLFFENEEFAYKVIAQGGWRMMTKGLQLMSPQGMFQFSLMHIAREMASKGEIQELVMEVMNEDNNKHCLDLLKNLVINHIDIMREEFIAKGGIRFLLACLASLKQWKQFQIINSGLFQEVALDIKGAKEMAAHNGIQLFIRLLVVGLNDDNVNFVYIENIIDIIRLLVKALEDPMKFLESLIDDIDVLEIHKTLLCRYYLLSLSFLPETLNVDINIAKDWLNSLGPPFNAFNISSHLHKDDCNVVIALIQLSEHIDIASMIMANEGILERFLIQLSKANLDNCAFELLKVVLQHEKMATQVVHQRPSFIKELLQVLPIEISSTFKYQNMYSVASLLFILAKHGGVFIKFIMNGGGIKILLNNVLLQNRNGRCDVIKVLGILAKDEDHALQIEKAGGSKMLLRAISCYLQYVHDTHLEEMIPYNRFIREYEDDDLVMCCLKTLSFLLNHEEIAKQISTRRGDSKECGIIALIDVMQTASQLWSSITLTLHEIVVTKKLMQIKGNMLTILSNVVSILVLMEKLHPHINISRKVNENVLKGIFQLQGMAIDEHQALQKALQDLLDIKKFHINTWSCQQLRSKTIEMKSYEGKAF
jgi:hypothetical protein